MNRYIKLLGISLAICGSLLCWQNASATSYRSEIDEKARDTGYVNSCFENLKAKISLGNYKKPDDMLSKSSSKYPNIGLVGQELSCKDLINNTVRADASKLNPSLPEKMAELKQLGYKESATTGNQLGKTSCAQFPFSYAAWGADYVGLAYTHSICIKETSNGFESYIEKNGDLASTAFPLKFDTKKKGQITITRLMPEVVYDEGKTTMFGTGKYRKTFDPIVFSNYTDAASILASIGDGINRALSSDVDKPLGYLVGSELIDSASVKMLAADVLKTTAFTSGILGILAPLPGIIIGVNSVVNSAIYTFVPTCDGYQATTDPEHPVECTYSLADGFGVEVTSSGLSDTEFEKETSKDQVLTNFSKGKYTSISVNQMDTVQLSPIEVYELYQYYLTELVGSGAPTCTKDKHVSSYGEQFTLWWPAANEYNENCYVVLKYDMDSTKVYGVKNLTNRLFGEVITLGDMQSQLKDLAKTLHTMAPSTTIGTVTSLDEDVASTYDPGDMSVEDRCWDSGIEGQSWLLCPTQTNLNEFVKIADKAIPKMLQVNQDLYNNDSPTKIAWDIMVGIANTLMIIILLVVVFSQLTGLGIDNYGIKKILPKLVVMAILVNLSFIICQIAVDLSNILGEGLQGMFEQIGNSVLGGDVGNMDRFVDYVISVAYALVGVGTFVGPVAAIAYNGGGPMVTVLIVLTLISIVAAILVFLAMLGARMIIIIFCVAVSPVAFTLYILPNTNKYFKKWFDLIKAALIIYPLCGAVLGLSYLIKAMVLESDSKEPLMYIVGVLAPFLPFFMLPTLLKGMLSILGAVGGAISSMGNAFKSGASSGAGTVSDIAKQSAGYQNAVSERARDRQWRNATRIVNRNARKKSLTPKEMRQGERAQQVIDKMNAEDTSALQAFYAEQYKNKGLKDLTNEFEKELAGFDSSAKDAKQRRNRIDAISNLMVQREGKDGVNKIVDIVSKGVRTFDTNGQVVSEDRVGLNEGQFMVLRDNMMVNRDFNTLMQKNGATAKMIKELGKGGSFRDYVVSATADGPLDSAKDLANQSKAETRNIVDTMNDIAGRVIEGGWRSVSPSEKEALLNVVQARDSIVNHPTEAIKDAVHNDLKKLQIWEGFNPSLPPLPQDTSGSPSAGDGGGGGAQGGQAATTQTMPSDGVAQEGQSFNISHNDQGATQAVSQTAAGGGGATEAEIPEEELYDEYDDVPESEEYEEYEEYFDPTTGEWYTNL